MYDIVMERPNGQRVKLLRVMFKSEAERFCARHGWFIIDVDGAICQLLYGRAQNR